MFGWFGFLLFFCIRLILSHLGVTQSESPISFIFKLIFFGLLMNASLFICEKILFFNSQISLAIRTLGEELFHTEINFSSLVHLLNSLTLDQSYIFFQSHRQKIEP